MQALLKGCIEQGFKRIRVHVLTDGRDVPDGSSYQFVEMLEKDLEELRKQYGVDVQIASGGGRMAVTMDRYEVGSHDHAEFPLSSTTIDTNMTKNCCATALGIMYGFCNRCKK